MIKDTHELNGFNTIKFPKLKGHVKLTLHNVHNKKNEVYEGDNIVTNAVADIMGANYLGGIDYSKILGDDGIWKTWFGGVLCFEDEHPNLNATDYYPYDSNTNALIAHAGQTPIDASHDDDTKRGNPTTNAYVFDETSAKMIWEWGTTHGNGVISALSLTHTDTGSYGLGSDTYDFKNNFCPYATLNQNTTFWNSGLVFTGRDAKMAMAMYDDSHSITFFPKEGTTDTVTVYIRKLAYLKAGILQTLMATDNQEVSFDIQTPFTFYNDATQYSPYYYFEPSTKYLWLFDNRTGANTWDSDDIKYCKIDTVNKELVDLGSGTYYATIHSNTGGIAPLGMYVIDRGGEFTSVHRIGNYFYFPMATSPTWSGYADQRGTNATGYIGIDITSTENEIVIPLNEVQKHPQTLTGQGIIISNGRVLNYHTGYTCKTVNTINLNNRNIILSSPNNLSTYGVTQVGGTYASTSAVQYVFANKMLLTTKYNLPTAVTKTPSQSMTVEYTITEQEPE